MGDCEWLLVYRIHILDCYTDPLGWKNWLIDKDISQEASSLSSFCQDVRNLDKLYSLIIERGKGKFFIFLLFVCLKVTLVALPMENRKNLMFRAALSIKVKAILNT